MRFRNALLLAAAFLVSGLLLGCTATAPIEPAREAETRPRTADDFRREQEASARTHIQRASADLAPALAARDRERTLKHLAPGFFFVDVNGHGHPAAEFLDHVFGASGPEHGCWGVPAEIESLRVDTRTGAFVDRTLTRKSKRSRWFGLRNDELDEECQLRETWVTHWTGDEVDVVLRRLVVEREETRLNGEVTRRVVRPPGEVVDPRDTRFLERALACIHGAPKEFEAVWGSPLLIESARIFPLSDTAATLTFEEEKPDGVPVGLVITVDFDGGTCVREPQK